MHQRMIFLFLPPLLFMQLPLWLGCTSQNEFHVLSFVLYRYMKYLYPYECEKRGLSSPGELQAAIDSNRREGRRQSYGSTLFNYSPVGTPTLLASPKLQMPHISMPTPNGGHMTQTPVIKKGLCFLLVFYSLFWKERERKMIFLIRKLNVIADLDLNYTLDPPKEKSSLLHNNSATSYSRLFHAVAWIVIRADRKQLAGLPLAHSASFRITPAGAMKHKETWAASWFSNVPIWKRTSHATLLGSKTLTNLTIFIVFTKQP